ncbi:MAG: hypothetical protein CSA66_03945 [Proteobacteria bacterium]|nr:MAG: hypothetical protein CSA66_03945 [Pseudomonadota bacterium]
MNVGTFRADDGVRLRWARVAIEAPRARVVVLQGRREFLEKYGDIFAALSAWGCDVWALDWRGQGGSERPLDNPHKGHIDSFDRYLADLHGWLEAVVWPGSDEALPAYLLGHSMGGHLALRYLHDRPGAFAAAALSAPMIGIRMGLPAGLARRLARRLVRRGWGDRYTPWHGDYDPRRRRFAGNRLTSDRARFDEVAALLAADPDLALGGPTWGWLAAALDSIATLIEKGSPEAIAARVLVALAGGDRVVDNRAARRLVRRLPCARLLALPRGCRHEITVEADAYRDVFLTQARALFELEG